ncbi:hypothetical protein WA158_006485 [Blastocystis sp. Blastoise]
MSYDGTFNVLVFDLHIHGYSSGSKFVKKLLLFRFSHSFCITKRTLLSYSGYQMDSKPTTTKKSKKSKAISRLDSLFASKINEKKKQSAKKDKNEHPQDSSNSLMTPVNTNMQKGEENSVANSKTTKSDLIDKKEQSQSLKYTSNSDTLSFKTNENVKINLQSILESENDSNVPNMQSTRASSFKTKTTSISSSPYQVSPLSNSISPLSPLSTTSSITSNKSKKLSINQKFRSLSNDELYRCIPQDLAPTLKTYNPNMSSYDFISLLVSNGPQGPEAVDYTLDNKFKRKTIEFIEEKNKKRQIMNQESIRARLNTRSRLLQGIIGSSESHKYHFFDIPKDLQKFDLYTPLYSNWKTYMKYTMKDSYENLNVADFHGCFLKVTQSIDPNDIGIKGIVLEETNASFLIITQTNQLRRILKKGRRFSFLLNKKLITIIGDLFMNRTVFRNEGSILSLDSVN